MKFFDIKIVFENVGEAASLWEELIEYNGIQPQARKARWKDWLMGIRCRNDKNIRSAYQIITVVGKDNFFHDDSMIFLLQFSYNILISLFFLDSQSLQVTHDA